MHRILFLTYHFPPEGGPAVQRVAKFCKYLPRYGILPTVLCAKKRNRVEDPGLLQDIPPEVRVVRTRDPGTLIPRFLRKPLQGPLQPDRHILWRKGAVKRGAALVKDQGLLLDIGVC